ncbi:MAG TPA: FtsQ-type POTRA domain-containing protein [Ruminiclostridium sp.]|nr:FtsQ-type POTRA domain-containing protein [Ruminiclostridium sp.]
MREEQNKGQRKRRKKRKPSKFAYFLLLLVIALCAAAICAAVFLKVNSIKISGKSQYSAEQIEKASGITHDTNLLSINKTKVVAGLRTILPYISDAKISIKLPSTVNIEVIEDSPEYVFSFENQYALIDGSLKALGLTKDIGKYKNLITLGGVKALKFEPGSTVKFQDGREQTAIKELSSAVKEAQISKVTGYNIGDSYQLSVVYDSRITIVIGTITEADKKLTDAAAIIKHKIQPSDKGTLDVSAQNKRYTFSPN